MSFTTEIKKELAALNIKAACCRHSLADGMLACAVNKDDGAVIMIRSSAEGVGELGARLVAERCRTSASLTSANTGGRLKTAISFVPKTGTDKIKAEFLCPNCGAMFARGVFLASGSVSDPSSCYHAELLVGCADSARVIFNVLDGLGVRPNIVERAGGVGLYYKSSGSIEELLGCIGATNALFRLINCKIERDIRNSENRATNCVAKNISKVINASQRQILDIEALTAAGRMEAMPYDIKLTARLRTENPDASLSELAQLHVPPISKSGLNHRLAKIAEEARKLFKN